MVCRSMTEADIERLIPMYIEYYNSQDGDEWTEETTYKRIHQVLSREDSRCMVLEDAGEIIALALGYYEQYDDGFAYDLVEIMVAGDCQKKGIGTTFMKEIEARVKKEGALLIQLTAVNDEFHEHFYGKLGYRNASNLVLKTKML